MPDVYLSPSTQDYNPYIIGGSEKYYMNLLADAMEPYLSSSGISYGRNDPNGNAAAAVARGNRGNYRLYLALHSNTARYVGINVKKVIMRTMLLSGALCGVTGLLLVSGTDHTIATNTVGGRGFTAIMVSWLAKFNPAYMILTSLLIVFFQKGAIQISTSLGLNDSFADIITGIIIFFIIGSEFFINYSVKFRSKEAKA